MAGLLLVLVTFTSLTTLYAQEGDLCTSEDFSPEKLIKPRTATYQALEKNKTYAPLAKSDLAAAVDFSRSAELRRRKYCEVRKLKAAQIDVTPLTGEQCDAQLTAVKTTNIAIQSYKELNGVIIADHQELEDEWNKMLGKQRARILNAELLKGNNPSASAQKNESNYLFTETSDVEDSSKLSLFIQINRAEVEESRRLVRSCQMMQKNRDRAKDAADRLGCAGRLSLGAPNCPTIK